MTDVYEQETIPQETPKLKGIDAKREKYADDLAEFNVRSTSGVENGLILERRCTDVFWLGAFGVTLATMLIMAFVSIGKGRPGLLVAPYDAAGNMCGFVKTDHKTGLPVNGAEDMKGFPLLYITKPDAAGAEKYASGVCVDECPKEAEVLTVASNCRDAGNAVKCPAKFKESYRVGMFCMPTSLTLTPA